LRLMRSLIGEYRVTKCPIGLRLEKRYREMPSIQLEIAVRTEDGRAVQMRDRAKEKINA